MNEKYLTGIGGGIILASFVIIVSFFVFQGIEEQVVIENGTPGFAQLAAIRDGAKNTMDNNTVVEEFKELVGSVTDQVKEKISPVVNQTIIEN
jgi:hypothetical protein